MLQVPDQKTKALLDLADFFEALDSSLYDQSTYLNHRTGARCICGWQNALIGHAEDDCAQASVALGLTHEIAKALFSGTGGQKVVRRRAWILPDIIEEPTPKEAAACLRHLAVTGELSAGW
jgi:hypothetical protein